MDTNKKIKIAKALKSLFDYIKDNVDDGNVKFNAQINNRHYKDMDIVKLIKTFSQSAKDCPEPDIDIIDVTGQWPRPIKRALPKKRQAPKRPLDQRTYWLKLIREKVDHYRDYSQQITSETENAFVSLCQMIEPLLAKNGRTLKISNPRSESQRFYGDPLIAVYSVSQKLVLSHYNQYALDQNSYYIKNLELRFGKRIAALVFKHLARLSAALPPASSETKQALGLTDYGTRKTWWDPTGLLRHDNLIKPYHYAILESTDYRETVLWKIPQIKRQIVLCYSDIFSIIYRAVAEDVTLKRQVSKAIINAFNSAGGMRNPNIMNNVYINGTDELIRIAENAVRNILPKVSQLRQYSVDYILRDTVPAAISKQIERYLLHYKETVDEQTFCDMAEDYIKHKPNDWRFVSYYVLRLCPQSQVKALIQYNDHPNIAEIASKISNESLKLDVVLLAMYAVAKTNGLSKSQAKRLYQVIPKDNSPQFESLVNKRHALSQTLLATLKALKQPVRKSIALNSSKIGNAKQDYHQTVDIVEDYLGMDNELLSDRAIPALEPQQAPAVIVQPLKTNSSEQIDRQFLEVLASRQSMPHSDVDIHAKKAGKLMTIFIDDINAKLYPYFDDQVIVDQGTQIVVDEFYVELLKEYVRRET